VLLESTNEALTTITQLLGKSVPAVKFLLHRLYRKTTIANRAALVAVLHPRENRPPTNS
jgi:DNA-binding CsgD family transcriptional regulator